MFISNEKGAVKSVSVNQIIAGFEDKLDTDTLTKIMDDPDWVDSYGTYIPDYQSEIDSILTEETDKYLLGSQSQDDTIKNLMDRGNEEIEENKIEAVSKPHIDIVNMKKGEDLVFTAIVQTRPEVELGKYKGIELKKIEYPVTDKDIEHELEHMQEHNARTITVEDRAVKDKDIAVIDFEGFVDGKPFEGGKAEKHELGIGSKTFIPGFEDQVIGMKINEEKDINVKFPEEYFSKDLAGKDATFKVKLHEIKEKKLPELDDEFAKDVSEFDTLQQLKESIKEKMQAENDHKAKHETESAAIEAVAKNTKIDIPS